MTNIAFFEPIDAPTGEFRYRPTTFAASLWAPGTLNGPAVCGLAARAVEMEYGDDEFVPARCTIDLFKAARDITTSTRVRPVRSGGRIRVVDVEVVQHPVDADEVIVARGTTVFLRTSSNPPGERWHRSPESVTFRPPATTADDLSPRFASDDAQDSVGHWEKDMSKHQNGHRKRMWTRAAPIVVGEQPTPFQRAVVSAESASLVSNWGTTGIGFINCDLTVAISRLPRGERVGVEADVHVEDDGVSVSNAGLYDADGMFGTALVTAVNNAAAQIDFTTVDTSERYREA
ncbi:acyl-CoA thioesterase domain-containing protein [Gordonia sp. 'Campus']|uniref:acyl-CoA thioesterase domain-containing protein n=1 Tax=Gordonia sp. 'Campus' TaxID=2915824 RepID=UPI001EE3D86B|nr:acyl-CoA thioesterase domain-containing protein [Gordonia sp. 'Campus']